MPETSTDTAVQPGPLDPPGWFVRALADEPEEGETVVEGIRIHHLALGAREHPTLVLAHGGAAHARSWPRRRAASRS